MRNSKDCRARSPPRTRRECEWEGSPVLLLERLVFSTAKKRRARGVEACVKRDASRECFATKRHGKIVGNGANLQGDRARKCDKSRG